MVLQRRCLLYVYLLLGGLPEWSRALHFRMSRNVQRWVASNLLAVSCSAVVVATATTHSKVCYAQQDFDFSNGQSVHLSEPLSIRLPNDVNHNNKILRLTHPVLVGWGGGGSVFAFDEEPNLLVKISWTDSAASVRRECRTLQYLQEQNVPSAERCLGVFQYPDDPKQRVMIVVSPYVRDAVASVHELPSDDAQAKAVQQVAVTLVQMLAHDIVTIDVQPLIAQASGEVIFIDMTEAQVLQGYPSSFLNQALMGSFTTEMLALIPEKWAALARQSVLNEVDRLADQGVTLSTEATEILMSQTFLFPDD